MKGKSKPSRGAGSDQNKHLTKSFGSKDVMTQPSKTDWKRVDAMTEEEIERNAQSDPDAQPMTDEEWERAPRVTLAELGIALPRPKKLVSLRIDADVLDWFRQQGRGYQSAMNAVLKAYKDAASTSRSAEEAAEKLSACLRQG